MLWKLEELFSAGTFDVSLLSPDVNHVQVVKSPSCHSPYWATG